MPSFAYYPVSQAMFSLQRRMSCPQIAFVDSAPSDAKGVHDGEQPEKGSSPAGGEILR